jgi:hypothetical protein
VTAASGGKLPKRKGLLSRASNQPNQRVAILLQKQTPIKQFQFKDFCTHEKGIFPGWVNYLLKKVELSY